jgi:hypothetical protein
MPFVKKKNQQSKVKKVQEKENPLNVISGKGKGTEVLRLESKYQNREFEYTAWCINAQTVGQAQK